MAISRDIILLKRRHYLNQPVSPSVLCRYKYSLQLHREFMFILFCKYFLFFWCLTTKRTRIKPECRGECPCPSRALPTHQSSKNGIRSVKASGRVILSWRFIKSSCVQFSTSGLSYSRDASDSLSTFHPFRESSSSQESLG